MRRIVLVSLIVLGTVACAGCGIDKDKGIFMAPGSYGDLGVVPSAAALTPMANRFLADFNTTRVFVIQEERVFNPDVFPPEKWELIKGYKNVLLLVALGEGGPVEKAARKVVSRESWERMLEAGGGVVQVNDPWSTYQYLIVVASRDRNSLAGLLDRNRDRLRQLFTDKNRERILRRHRYEGLNEQLMTTLWKRFGFFLEIPTAFPQNQVEPEGFPGIEFMQTGPSRGVTVAWRDVADPVALLADHQALTDFRAEMGERMHGEELVPESFAWSETEIQGVACVKLEGAWNSQRIAGGGPFWAYFIPDPDRGRLFCLDLLVFAPGMDKMDMFRRLEAIASTFATKRPQP